MNSQSIAGNFPLREKKVRYMNAGSNVVNLVPPKQEMNTAAQTPRRSDYTLPLLALQGGDKGNECCLTET